MDCEGTITLLSAILSGIPSLPRAARIGHHALYDEIPGRPSSDEGWERYQATVMVCSRCPVQAQRSSRRTDPPRRCKTVKCRVTPRTMKMRFRAVIRPRVAGRNAQVDGDSRSRLRLAPPVKITNTPHERCGLTGR